MIIYNNDYISYKTRAMGRYPQIDFYLAMIELLKFKVHFFGSKA